MACDDFTFPEVQRTLSLPLEEADLFSATPVLALRPEFVTERAEDVQLALHGYLVRTCEK